MFGNWYNSSLRRYIVLVGDLFSNIQVARKRPDGVKFIKVPITYASKERFLYNLYKNAITADGTPTKLETILPRINFQMVSMIYNADYKTNMLNRTTKSGTKQTGVSQYNPVPVKLTFELGVFTRLQDDMFQILEQIVPYFQPHFNTTMTELYGNDVTFDRDIRIVLKDTSPDERIEGDNISRRHLEWLLTFELNGWIYPPVTSLEGEIHAVYLDFFANEKTIGAEGNFESVDTIATTTDPDNWDGSVEKSYTSNTPIPPTAVLRE